MRARQNRTHPSEYSVGCECGRGPRIDLASGLELDVEPCGVIGAVSRRDMCCGAGMSGPVDFVSGGSLPRRRRHRYFRGSRRRRNLAMRNLRASNRFSSRGRFRLSRSRRCRRSARRTSNRRPWSRCSRNGRPRPRRAMDHRRTRMCRRKFHPRKSFRHLTRRRKPGPRRSHRHPETNRPAPHRRHRPTHRRPAQTQHHYHLISRHHWHRPIPPLH